MQQFQTGDLVQLISGGPIMTVEAVYPDGMVQCVWFDEKSQTCTNAFRAEIITIPQNTQNDEQD